MKKLFIALIIVLLSASLSWGACPGTPADCYVKTGTDPYTYAAIDCSYDAVNESVQAADDGDTVTVPACSETTWDDSLIITKAIILQGGVGGTTSIKSGYTSVGYHGLIAYEPATPDSNHRFRVTNFTLNNDGKCYLLSADANTSTPEYIRIDHIIATVTGRYKAFHTTGPFFGVIDNNVVTATGSAGIATAEGNDSGRVGAQKQWGVISRDHGDEKNLYYEDNVFSEDNGVMIGSGIGGRYLFRYNQLTTTTATIAGEAHGNQPGGLIGASLGGNSSTMIMEFYGNIFTKTATYFNYLYDQRGGKLMFFYNKIVNPANNSNTQMFAREEYSDLLWPDGNTEVMHSMSYSWANWQHKTVNTTLLSMDVSAENCCLAAAEAWQDEHHYGGDIICKKFTGDSNGDCWKSYPQAGTTGTSGTEEPNWEGTAHRYVLTDGGMYWLNMGAGTPIQENVDIFTQKTGTFDGTGVTGGGVGCGTLAALQGAAYYTSCTPGVGYWATDQSCTDISDFVGASTAVTGGTRTPTNVITGKLYKCNAEGNGWDVYFTPYTYPHLLRGETSGGAGHSFSGGASHSFTGGSTITWQ